MIDKNAKGILFVVDEVCVLKGCLTDGDIRRWLIKTGDLNAHISDAMNKPALDILGFVINNVVDFISKPITLFWGLIL